MCPSPSESTFWWLLFCRADAISYRDDDDDKSCEIYEHDCIAIRAFIPNRLWGFPPPPRPAQWRRASGGPRLWPGAQKHGVWSLTLLRGNMSNVRRFWSSLKGEMAPDTLVPTCRPVRRELRGRLEYLYISGVCEILHEKVLCCVNKVLIWVMQPAAWLGCVGVRVFLLLFE